MKTQAYLDKEAEVEEPW